MRQRLLVGKIDVSDKEMNRDVKTEPKVFRQMFGCHSGERGIEHVLGHTPSPAEDGAATVGFNMCGPRMHG